MELVNIEKELENIGCIAFLFNGIGNITFYKNFGRGVLLRGEIQESKTSYVVAVTVNFIVSVSGQEVCSSEEGLLELEVAKTDINEVLERIEYIVKHLQERFDREEHLLETLPSDIKDVNDVKVDVLSKLFDTFSTIGIVLDCGEGHLGRIGMINLYVTLESIGDASAIVEISYAGALKYKRYIDATNVDEEIENIKKCVETFKENFIDSETLLKELESL